MCNCKNKSCACQKNHHTCGCNQTKTYVRNLGSYSSCCEQEPLPAQKNPICCKPEKSCGCQTDKCGCKKPKNPCFEEVCEEGTFDLSQIRYKTNCDEDSELINLNINKGDNLEYIIETIGKKVLSLSFQEAPEIEERPDLDSLEKIILYLYNKVKYLP